MSSCSVAVDRSFVNDIGCLVIAVTGNAVGRIAVRTVDDIAVVDGGIVVGVVCDGNELKGTNCDFGVPMVVGVTADDAGVVVVVVVVVVSEDKDDMVPDCP